MDLSRGLGDVYKRQLLHIQTLHGVWPDRRRSQELRKKKDGIRFIQ
jgi:hypothetical protein